MIAPAAFLILVLCWLCTEAFRSDKQIDEYLSRYRESQTKKTS